MNKDELYIMRCLELASNGLGKVAPNPMVGSVVVHNGKIIGEGFHTTYGKSHAEVNAINSVSKVELLKESTLYVNLEPCSHHGKTPPCADFIIEHQIPKVVIGTTDPYYKVAGKGIEKLKSKGIEVTVNVLGAECMELNRRFFTFHRDQRPYIILKWAQTLDGFMARDANSMEDRWITNNASKRLSHKWRAEEQAILVGTDTAIIDNPQLTTRLYDGKNPLRLVMDKRGRIPKSHHIFDNDTPTLVFTEENLDNSSLTEYEIIDFTNKPLLQVMKTLVNRDIQSIIVEGGRKLLDDFIKEGLWDEARIFIGNKTFTAGIPAPLLDLEKGIESRLDDDRLFFIKNHSKR